MIKSIFLLFIISILSINQLIAQNNFDKGKYKYIRPIMRESEGDINVIKDSVKFEGYMVFEIKKNINCKKYVIDSNSYQCDIYWSKDLAINKSNKYYYNIARLDYDIYYNLDNLDLVRDSSKLPIEFLEKINSSEYKRFKAFYKKFSSSENEQLSDTPFLFRGITTKIFDDTNAIFYNYIDHKNIGYFIFSCSFYAGILEYNTFYLIDDCCNCKNYTRNFDGVKSFLFPTSPAIYFKSVTREEMENAGFIQSKWTPEKLYNK